MKHQATTKSAKVNTYDLQLAFAKARTRFAELGIRKPMPFIEWKRPDLTFEQRTQLMFALCGRVSPKHATLLPVVEKVLEELQAA